MFLCEFIGKDESRIREYLKTRQYKNGRMVQVREVKVLDFAVPREIEEQFLKDMAAQHIYDKGEYGDRSSILNAVKWIAKLFGIEQIKFAHIPDIERFAGTKSKFMMIGKLPDHIDEEGREMY